MAVETTPVLVNRLVLDDGNILTGNPYEFDGKNQWVSGEDFPDSTNPSCLDPPCISQLNSTNPADSRRPRNDDELQALAEQVQLQQLGDSET